MEEDENPSTKYAYHFFVAILLTNSSLFLDLQGQLKIGVADKSCAHLLLG